jgi:platelet-activating factor acetylhydrolase
MYPHVCSLALKMVANPRRALDLNINASLEFLSHVLPRDLAQVCRAFTNEKLLESNTSPLDRIPSTQLHRPKEGWMAMRLRIRHEWLFRTSPSLFRKVQRYQHQRKGRSPETGDEVWLHIKPTKESMEQHLKDISTQGGQPAKAMAKTHNGGPNEDQAVAGAELVSPESKLVSQDP